MSPNLKFAMASIMTATKSATKMEETVLRLSMKTFPAWVSHATAPTMMMCVLLGLWSVTPTLRMARRVKVTSRGRKPVTIGMTTAMGLWITVLISFVTQSIAVPAITNAQEPAQCVNGACFRTYWVDETLGSNANGDGSQRSPWRLSLCVEWRPSACGGCESRHPSSSYLRYAGAICRWINGWIFSNVIPRAMVSLMRAALSTPSPVKWTTIRKPLSGAQPVNVMPSSNVDGRCSLPESEREVLPVTS